MGKYISMLVRLFRKQRYDDASPSRLISSTVICAPSTKLLWQKYEIVNCVSSMAMYSSKECFLYLDRGKFA
eukprot:XP_001706378.1 Hypothetical protein GL50803_34882 [Giardia lamblia ATCC 50803]